MSLSGLGNVIISLINGAKHVPHRCVELIIFKHAINLDCDHEIDGNLMLDLRQMSSTFFLVSSIFEDVFP